MLVRRYRCIRDANQPAGLWNMRTLGFVESPVFDAPDTTAAALNTMSTPAEKWSPSKFDYSRLPVSTVLKEGKPRREH